MTTLPFQSNDPTLPMVSSEPKSEIALPELFGQKSRFRFYGKASEYFGIWLVNWLLTIMTLSLYSPWAKVRRLRYFYTHTELEGARFDFTGQARAIFIGRIAALAVYFGAHSEGALKGSWLQWVAGVLLFAIYAIIPYLFRATYRFKARNTVYRHVRFKFTGTWRQAFMTYWGFGLLVIISLGLLLPYYIYRHKRYQFSNLQLGRLKFQFHAKVRHFYVAMWFPMLLLVGLYVGLTALAIYLSNMDIHIEDWKDAKNILWRLSPLIFVFLMVLASMYWITSALVFRLCWSRVSLGRSDFTSDLSVFKYLWIAYSNFWICVMTLGMMIPWAIIRVQRYRINSVSIEWQDDPQEILAVMQADLKAFGEELNDLIGIDLSL
ncbi:YjgN family protein [Aquirhabdus parva]|uniref:DUF898 domain-containing protein n=1 Tax=Aquirhabdus parva TaxID=2283318 RepID=A0A345P337_9GAMM|nr:YjgN family protein [Aquirhabdus parva]AXI01696.1 DUF898 domain-containing protein [Aquirhabdus parva]